MNQNDLFRKSALETVSSPEKLNRYIKIVTPGAALVLAGLLALLLGGIVWACFGSLPTTISASGALISTDQGSGPTEALIMVDADTAAALSPGMSVQVSLHALPRDQYGYLAGTVARLSAYPASEAEVLALVRNAEQTRRLLSGDADYLAVVSLEPDAGAENGLHWSHGSGATQSVQAGMPCTALFLTEVRRPIDLILGGA